MSTSPSPDDVLQLIGAGRLEEAEQICLHAQKETGNAEYIYLRGIVHAQQQNFTEAIKLCEEASQQLPDRADIAYNFGVICYSANDLKRAVTAWQHTVEIDKTHDDANFNLALGLDQLGQEKEAQKTYEMLLTVNPKHELALYNLANLKTRLNESEKALPLYNRLLALKPDFEAGWINYGMAAQRAGTLKEAEDHFKKAIALNPQSVDAHWNLSHLLLIQGHWQEGFAEYEWRLQRAEAPKPEWPQPVWDGSKIKNQHLLLWVDQGVGDAIQFLRYVQFAAERVKSITLRCQQSLVRLADTVPGIDQVIAMDDPLPTFDIHAPLMSLAHILGNTDPAGSWHGEYLSPPQEFTLEMPKHVRHIGLVWAGNPAHRNDSNRSCPLEVLQPLLDVPDTAFYSLQVGSGPTGLSSTPGFENVTDLAPRLDDFADTAAAIEALDLVISVDTAVAHLAGALGKPAWVFIPAIDTDWRWQLEGTVTDWYPSLHLFRQQTPGDWPHTVADMAAALAKS